MMDGQPEGKADVYWLSAQREILTTSLEGSRETAAGKQDTAWREIQLIPIGLK
jgi:hypothetical protein